MLKYNTSGDLVWSRLPVNGAAFALHVQANGDSVSTGLNFTPLHKWDMYTLKMSADGDFQWGARLNSTTNGDDQGTGDSQDDSGNSYVTGYTSAGGDKTDMRIVKYSPAGAKLWAKTYVGATSNSRTVGKNIVALPAGGCIVQGDGWDLSDFNSNDVTLSRYDDSGTLQWRRKFDGPEHGIDLAKGLAMDHLGNVVMALNTSMFGSGYDAMFAKYSPGGAVLWSRRATSVWDESEEISGLSVAADNTIYAVGTLFKPSNVSEIWVIKFNTVGTRQWTYRDPGTGGTPNFGSGIGTDSANRAVVVGSTTTGAGQETILFQIH